MRNNSRRKSERGDGNGDSAGEPADEDPSNKDHCQEYGDIPPDSRWDNCRIRGGTHGSRRPDTKQSLSQTEEDLGADGTQAERKIYR